MRLQDGKLLIRDDEHEIRRKPIRVTSNLLVQSLCTHAVEKREVIGDNHPLAPKGEDSIGDLEGRHSLHCAIIQRPKLTR